MSNSLIKYPKTRSLSLFTSNFSFRTSKTVELIIHFLSPSKFKQKTKERVFFVLPNLNCNFFVVFLFLIKEKYQTFLKRRVRDFCSFSYGLNFLKTSCFLENLLTHSLICDSVWKLEIHRVDLYHRVFAL